MREALGEVRDSRWICRLVSVVRMRRDLDPVIVHRRAETFVECLVATILQVEYLAVSFRKDVGNSRLVSRPGARCNRHERARHTRCAEALEKRAPAVWLFHPF